MFKTIVLRGIKKEVLYEFLYLFLMNIHKIEIYIIDGGEWFRVDKNVQLLIVAIIGTVAILTVVNRQTDLAQVCVAGLIGFLGAKATGITDTMANNSGYELTIKKNETENEEGRATKTEVKEMIEEAQNEEMV